MGQFILNSRNLSEVRTDATLGLDAKIAGATTVRLDLFFVRCFFGGLYHSKLNHHFSPPGFFTDCTILNHHFSPPGFCGLYHSKSPCFTTIWGICLELVPSIMAFRKSNSTKTLGRCGFDVRWSWKSPAMKQTPWNQKKGKTEILQGGGNSNIFNVHPYLGKWSTLTN